MSWFWVFSRLDNDLKLQAQQRLQYCHQLAEQQLQRRFPLPTLSFDQRGRIAGSARLQSNHIRLNAVLLADNPDEFMHEVIPHEFCHLLVWQLHGRGSLFGRVRPHGPQWKGLMKSLFNLNGTSTHRMDISKVAGRQFPYHCQCGPVQLSIRRHNRIQKGVVYHCRRCQQALVATHH